MPMGGPYRAGAGYVISSGTCIKVGLKKWLNSRLFYGQNRGGRVFTLPPACDALSRPANHPTGDFLPCVSGGLSFEIVRIAVNHNGPSYDIAHTKPACQHLAIRSAVVTEQRRKVTGVLWMQCSVWIIMTACVWKTAAAAVPMLVDMKSKEARLRIGQAAYVSDNKRPSAAWEETDGSPQLRMILSAADMGYCGGHVVPCQNKSPHTMAMRCAVLV